MKKRNDSPIFEDLICWLKRKDAQRIHAFFSLRDYSTWMRVRPGWRPTLTNLNGHRKALREELIGPLFLRPSLKVRYERDCGRHRKDNALCCVEFHRKRLKRIPSGDLEAALKEFRADFQKALPGARFPFSWMIDHRDPVAKEWDELMARERELERQTKEALAVGDLPLEEVAEADEAARYMIDIEKRDLTWAKEMRSTNDRKRQYALRICGWLLMQLKAGRGRPGRHPKEFNVLVYHVIKKCTHRKLDWKRRAAGLDPSRRRKDGQFRLETDWKLVMFLLLDAHAHAHEFPELARFMSRHKRERAARALAKMQAWLLNIRKNFPAIHGWPMNKEGFPDPETGFRKFYVGEGGRLKLVQL